VHFVGELRTQDAAAREKVFVGKDETRDGDVGSNQDRPDRSIGA